MKFEAEGQEFAKVLRSLEQFIQNVKRWRFLGSNILKKNRIQIETNNWDLETYRKSYKNYMYSQKLRTMPNTKQFLDFRIYFSI